MNGYLHFITKKVEKVTQKPSISGVSKEEGKKVDRNV